jgi:hypothetical protein
MGFMALPSLLGILSLCFPARSFPQGKPGPRRPLFLWALENVPLVLSVLIVYSAFMPHLGYLLSTFSCSPFSDRSERAFSARSCFPHLDPSDLCDLLQMARPAVPGETVQLLRNLMDLFDSILYGFGTFSRESVVAIGVLIEPWLAYCPAWTGGSHSVLLLPPSTSRPASLLCWQDLLRVQYGGSTTSILVNIPGEASW